MEQKVANIEERYLSLVKNVKHIKGEIKQMQVIPELEISKTDDDNEVLDITFALNAIKETLQLNQEIKKKYCQDRVQHDQDYEYSEED